MATKREQLLYNQLVDRILKDYQNRPYYSPLPGERELCEIYQVSRPTVRKALELLETDGCVTRFPGKGTFFIGTKSDMEDKEQVSANIAFYNQVRLRGDYTTSKVLTQKAEFVSPEVAKILGMSEGDRVFHLERLRYINDVLWTLADAYIPYDLCPQLLQYDFADRSLHNTLAAYGHVPFRAKRHITARKATEYEAFNLGLEADAPLCVTETCTYDYQDNLLEYSISRGDVYHISFHLTTFNETQDSKDKIHTERVKIDALLN
ncbi:MAG: GntR family transcriptional regulator [Clostridiales bacterium]|nr:GntR family transcriptional regulator [Clostridiales bacterium]